MEVVEWGIVTRVPKDVHKSVLDFQLRKRLDSLVFWFHHEQEVDKNRHILKATLPDKASPSQLSHILRDECLNGKWVRVSQGRSLCDT